MLPHGTDAGQPRRGYDERMVRPLAVLSAALSLLAAAPARAQGSLEPSGRLPPVSPRPGDGGTPESPPKKAVAVETPAAPLTRGAVLEQVSGIVRQVDRKDHKFTVEPAGGDRVTLSMDRNTMVYTSAGLGTVLDVVPGAVIRAGRNADFVAYWVQVRPPPGKGMLGAPQPPAQGTGPAGGSGAPAERGGPVAPPAGSTTTPSGPAGGTAP